MLAPRLARATIVGAALTALVSLDHPARTQDAPPPDLTSIFSLGHVLQDRNDDGVVDTVDARFVLGETPTADEVAAAADVALRLGFETSAMTLPLATGDADASTIFVFGQSGLQRTGVDAKPFELPALAKGDGVVRVGQLGDKTYVIVLGGDGAGLRAAAGVLAGRVPWVWEPKGTTLAKVKDDVVALLGNAKVTGAVVDLPEIDVRAGSPGLERVVVGVRVPALTAMSNAMFALQRVQQERDRGAGSTRTATLSYAATRTVSVRLAAPDSPSVSIDVPRAGVAAMTDGAGRRPGNGAKDALDLSTLYTIDGLLGDGDSNLIPDRVDAVVTASGPGLAGVVDFAARLGLESTGITLPLVVAADSLKKPDAEPPLVIVGTSHPLLDELVEAKKIDRPTLAEDEGAVLVVRKAFGDRTAVVVTGGGPTGLERALAQLAERFPHIWARGRDRTTLDDVEEDVRKFVSGRSPAGQAAMALYKTQRLLTTLAARKAEPSALHVFVEKPDAKLAAFLASSVQARANGGNLSVSVEPLDVANAKPIEVNGKPISEEFTIPSEVEEFWQIFNTKVLKDAKKGKSFSLEARLSEPPEIRDEIAREVTAQLVKKGLRQSDVEVRVLSAYKQGFSWLNDVIRPQLADKPVGDITIRFAEIGPPKEWPQQAVFTPTRWVLELFPIDEVLARELKIDLGRIHFEKRPVGSPTYEVVVTSPDGNEILKRQFEPKVVLRSYFDRFPDYEKVRVTTGWVSASSGGKTIVDQRIATDPERFWDHFQATTLPAIYDYVMAMTDGKPRAVDAPHFGELTVDVTLSEPDYALGVDKEQIASMEALHEDIYFGVLHFFDVLGRFTRGAGLNYPGRVIPIVHPVSTGKAGRARIGFTGFGATRPSVVADYRDAEGTPRKMALDIPRIAIDRPSALGAFVKAGRDGLTRLDVRVKVDAERDMRDEWVARARTDRVDETMLSAEQVTAVVGNLNALRKAGLYSAALSYHDLGELRVSAAWTHDVDRAHQSVTSLDANGTPAPFPNSKTLLPSGYRYAGGPIVQWETPIPPPEAHQLLAKMAATFKEATAYRIGESYLGKDIWAMDLMSPVDASHWSQAKATTSKPTIVYSARQHANEVSSTSHVLRLAERLLTDAAYKAKLKRANVVIHPMTNPDGAQLAYDLYKVTPDHMLHAGYLGSLGVDVTQNQWDPDPILPESAVRPRLWRMWLPDIFLNPHGYPSHEWVQLFSEYAGWVRNRVTDERNWWGMRGWFIPGFGYLDDPKYPQHKDAAFAIRDRITKNINAVPELKAFNERAYARYRRYGFALDPENFKMDLTNGVMVYTAIKGAKADPRAEDFMARQPNVTTWSGSTEAPDETAHGEWLQFVANAGLQFDTAVLDWLLAQPYKVERREEPWSGGMTLAVGRARPPKPETVDDKDPAPGPRQR
ncbi:MAG: M14 family zinc carboxypeptidase [Vicinamibacterales bacterium]